MPHLATVQFYVMTRHLRESHLAECLQDQGHKA